MHYDLILKNGILVTPEKSFEAGIAVKNGKIALTGKLDEDTADEIYDAAGRYILPGIIDAHVHFREPGLTDKEDFESGSAAAAFGGVTTVADMPNVIPATSTAARFLEKAAVAREKTFVDFALFALLTDENSGEMEELKKAGALGFKVFLGTSTGDIAAPSPGILERQMKTAASLGMRVGFHAETGALNSYHTSLCKNMSGLSSILLSQARPVFSEALAIQTAICFAQYIGAKIHIHHITSTDGALLAGEAKRKGVDITSETCPHYLLLDTDSGKPHKVYPPIRDESHRKGLWDAVGKGIIDMIASDHAPHTAAEKALPIWEAPAGLCGVETFVPLLLNEVNRGTLSLNDFVRLSSEAPAKIWGIYPQKGNLLPGADADFTVVDMKMKRKISACDMRSKSKTTPFDGVETQGTPVAAIVRGKFVMKDGRLTGEKGGILISPER
jgi:dihydroorotase